MSNLPQTFDFNGLPIDVHIINGEPFWIGKDVCEVLEIAHSASSLRHLDEDEKGVHTVHTLGGPQELAVINESGLYSLILRSRKPVAKAFKRWVTHEVIPTIRRTGMYAAQGSDASLAIANAFDKLAERMEAQTEAITAQISDLSKRVIELEVSGAAKTRSTRYPPPEPPRRIPQRTLMGLPDTGRDLEPLTYREQCSRIVGRLWSATGRNPQEHWKNAYSEYCVRANINVRDRTRKKGFSEIIAYIEQYGNIELLYTILMQMLERVEEASNN